MGPWSTLVSSSVDEASECEFSIFRTRKEGAEEDAGRRVGWGRPGMGGCGRGVGKCVTRTQPWPCHLRMAGVAIIRGDNYRWGERTSGTRAGLETALVEITWLAKSNTCVEVTTRELVCMCVRVCVCVRAPVWMFAFLLTSAFVCYVCLCVYVCAFINERVNIRNLWENNFRILSYLDCALESVHYRASFLISF